MASSPKGAVVQSRSRSSPSWRSAGRVMPGVTAWTLALLAACLMGPALSFAPGPSLMLLKVATCRTLLVC